ncbi:MAG: short-chain dehydrogenase/reductase [Clostridiaceae bacterium]|jgi:NAD(P)-dependent dehydrogenase (short-subunit alcohol dehydrogenase family)|nr:short-chain dehydrogenase/reductase [Clostridiaceae bacterium]
MAESRREDLSIMKNVCVITGGGSGMGLATAKILGKNHYIVIVGRTVKKLDNALAELKAEGIEAEAFACDVSDRDSVNKLANHSAELGKVTAVIHAAGMSPHMGDAQKIMAANALGTINMNEAFYQVMECGSCILDVSSMSGYMIPKIILPTSKYALSLKDEDLFMKKMMARVNLFPKKQRSGIAYGVSKNFVIWYAKKCAGIYGDKGIRVVSVSPGNFETPMGKLEEEEADKFTKYCAIKRFGKVEEIAYLFASCVDEHNGYLTGVDILCDGGLVASGMNPLKK